MSMTIDASVWIAAADATDKFHQASRDLLRRVITRGIAVIQPAFGRVEVACALSRRLRDGARGQQLTHSLMNRMITSEMAMDAAFLTATERLGTSQFLRGADALYAAAARQSQSPLISWDNEHLQRAGAITPTDWLVANP
ncbi:MAG: PIN domain-containing protein [Verrucomicrobiaceae bacterium]|nr:PIN domain-containing protein [Verrucomicrobiaceae bacterium]